MKILWIIEYLPVVFMEQIYGTVAIVYNSLMDLIKKTDEINSFFGAATKSLYTLIGVFMLFRVGISLITMLVDPEKISDKQEGAGKIISRILISIVLLLSMNFIFDKLTDIQTILLDQIPNFAQSLFFSSDDCKCPTILGIEARKQGTSCYYNFDGSGEESFECFKVTDLANNLVSPDLINENSCVCNTISSIVPTKKGKECHYKIDDNSEFIFGCKEGEKWANIENGGFSFNESFNIFSSFIMNVDAKEKSGNDIYLLFDFFEWAGDALDTVGDGIEWVGDKIEEGIEWAGDALDDVWEAVSGEEELKKCHCPPKVPGSGIETGGGPGTPTYHPIVGAFTGTKVDCTYSYNASYGIQPGKTQAEYQCLSGGTLKGTKCETSAPCEGDTSIPEPPGLLDPADPEVEYNREFISALITGDSLPEFSSPDNDGKKFARSLAGAFFTSDSDTIKKWFNYENGLFLTVKNELREKYKDDSVGLDLFMGLVMGIIALVFLVILMIEVVVRGFKLALLKVISPIAIMSYINPKDKIFNQWVKMYLATYADLFLKLMAIVLVPYFLIIILNGNSFFEAHPFLKLLYVLGVFLFAKGLPDLISNVFGIKAAGGTFKEAAGLAKTGAMMGAGAVAGGIAGAATGLGHGGNIATVAGGLLGGIGRGAAGGSKGKMLQGAKDQHARNKTAKASNVKAGALMSKNPKTWFGAAGERAKSKIGMDSASKMDRKMEDMVAQNEGLDEIIKANDAAEKAADSTNFLSTVMSMMNSGQLQGFTQADYKKLRENYMDQQVAEASKKGSGDFSAQTLLAGVKNGNLLGNISDLGAGHEEAEADIMLRSVQKAQAAALGRELVSNVTGTKIFTAADLRNAVEKSGSVIRSNNSKMDDIKYSEKYMKADAVRGDKKDK